MKKRKRNCKKTWKINGKDKKEWNRNEECPTSRTIGRKNWLRKEHLRLSTCQQKLPKLKSKDKEDWEKQTKTEKNIQELQRNYKKNNLHIMVLPEGKERERKTPKFPNKCPWGQGLPFSPANIHRVVSFVVQRLFSWCSPICLFFLLFPLPQEIHQQKNIAKRNVRVFTAYASF